MPSIVNRETPLNFKTIFKISMDCDAVSHEKSEYVIGFKIWWTGDE
jgi:hypothetical protein